MFRTKLIFIVTLVACTGSGQMDQQPSLLEDGKAAFEEAFLNDRYEDLPAARDLLERANAENPEDPATVQALFYAWFWTVGEYDRAVPPATPEEMAQGFARFTQLNIEARDRNPNDTRHDGWLGATLMFGARAQNDALLAAQGRALLESGRERYPAFGNFMTVIAFADQPLENPDWAEARSAMWAMVDICAGARVDRKNPDLSTFVEHTENSAEASVCWSNPKAPHLFEGTYLYFGNLLAKQGDIEAAKVMYQNVQLAPGFSSWRDRSIAIDILTADLGARAQLYRDENPENDPETKPRNSCTGCHAK